MDPIRAKRFNRILEFERHREVYKKLWIHADNYALALYQNGKFLGYKNPGYQGNIVINASFPKIKAEFFGLGKYCKNVDSFFLDTSEHEFRFSVRAKTKNAKTLVMAGNCKFAVTDIDIQKFLEWAKIDFSNKPIGHVEGVIMLDKIQSLINDTYLKTCFELLAKEQVIPSQYECVIFPNEQVGQVVKDMAYFAKLRFAQLGLTVKIELFPEQLNK